MERTDKKKPSPVQGKRKPRKQAGGGSQPAKEYWQSLVENTSDLVTIIDTNAVIIYQNAAVERVLGYKPDEFIGKAAANFIQADDMSHAWKVFSTSVATPRSEYPIIELHVRHKDGRWRTMETTGEVRPNDTGELVAIMTSRDVTERKQAEDMLRESEKQHRDLFDNAGLAIFQVTAEGKPIVVNPEFVRMFGYASSADFLGTVKNTTILFADPQRRAEVLRQKAENPNLMTFENLYRRKDGSTFLGLLTLRELKDLDGHTVCLEGVVEDITERRHMEQALQESEERFRTAFHTSPDAININRLEDGLYVDINEGFTALTGYSRNEVIGKSSLELNIWNDPADREKLVKGLRESGQVNNLEARFKMKGGQLVTALMSARIIQLNNVPHILSITREIEEMKRAEVARQESEARYRLLVERLPAITYVISAAPHKTLYISPQIEMILGFTPQEWIADAGIWQRQIHPDDLERVLAEDEASKKTGRSFLCEYRTIARDGHIVWLHDETHHILVPGQEPILQGIEFDITERKRAEAQLELSLQQVEHSQHLLLSLSQAAQAVQRARSPEEVYTAIQEQMTYLGYKSTVMELTEPQEDLHIAYINYDSNLVHKAEKLTGLSARTYHFHPHPEGIFQRVLAQGETVYSADAAQAVADVLPKRLHSLAQPISNMFHLEPCTFAPLIVEGKTIGVLAVTGGSLTEEDNPAMTAFANQTSIALYKAKLYEQAQQEIVERKQAEEEIRTFNTELEMRVDERTRELREAQEKLVRQEKLAVLGQLAGGVGHELRNPLGIINNAAYYLRLIQPQADEKVKEYLGIIEHETRTADKIITDLLDFSRIKSVDKESVSVKGLIEQTLVRFPIPENVDLKLKIRENLPSVEVDTLQMTQVLGNLVVNACQAMTSYSSAAGVSNGRELTITAARKGKEVTIAVKDIGTGISPENMGKLFEPLFTTKPKGIGLGLAVSKKLVEVNQGRIEVQSKPGEGATFTVFLPVDKENG